MSVWPCPHSSMFLWASWWGSDILVTLLSCMLSLCNSKWLPSVPRTVHLRPWGHPGVCRFHSPVEMRYKLSSNLSLSFQTILEAFPSLTEGVPTFPGDSQIPRGVSQGTSCHGVKSVLPGHTLHFSYHSSYVVAFPGVRWTRATV